MTTTIATTNTIKGFAVPLDEDDLPIEADAPPDTGDLSVVVNGAVVVTGTKTVGTWAGGYFFSWAPAAPFSAGDVIRITLALTIGAVIRFHREQWTAVAIGGGDFYVLPLVADMPGRSTNSAIDVWEQESITIAIPLVDAAGDPVDLTGESLWFAVFDKRKQNVFTPLTGGSVTGTSTGFTVALPKMSGAAVHEWILRRNDSNQVRLTGGVFTVKAATYPT